MTRPHAPVNRSRRRLVALAAALFLVVGTAGLALADTPPPPPGGAGGSTPIPIVAPTPTPVPTPAVAPGPGTVPINLGSIVWIGTIGTQGGQSWTGEGYGVVVDPSGLILANATVVAPDAPGAAVGYADPSLPATVSEIDISVIPGAGQPLTPTYTGKVLAVDGYLDLAIVGLATTLGPSAAPVVPGSVALPAVALGQPVQGEPVTVVQDTTSAGNFSPSALTGTLTTEKPDARTGSTPGWEITDVPMSPDFPGGVLILDGHGALIAFPTFEFGYPPSLVQGRPAAFVQTLLAAAKSGAPYTSPYVVAGTGQEQMAFGSWTTSTDPCNAANPGKVTKFPTKAVSIYTMFTASAMTQAEDLLSVWYDPTQNQLLALSPYQWQGTAGGCFADGLSNGGQALPDGSYALDMYAGGSLRQVASETTTIGGSNTPGSVTVTGRVINADTGKPIAGALFVVLKIGVDVSAWFSSPDQTQVASSATTGADGTYSTAPPIAPGVYPYVVAAQGYQAVGGSLDISQGGTLDDISLAPIN